jgi:hypothetical protein
VLRVVSWPRRSLRAQKSASPVIAVLATSPINSRNIHRMPHPMEAWR